MPTSNTKPQPYEIILDERVKNDNSGPWATSGTTKDKIILWTELKTDEILNIIKNRWGKGGELVCRSIEEFKENKIDTSIKSPSTKNIKEFEFIVSTTVYYN